MDYERFKEGFHDALKAELTARRVDKMNESYLDMETMNIVNTQMYIDGY